MKNELLGSLKSSLDFFHRSTGVFAEEHSSFRPTPEIFSVAEQVAHTAQAVDWFFEGAFRKEGFDTDFKKLEEAVREYTSLSDARQWLRDAYARAMVLVQQKSEEELRHEIPSGQIMAGAPKYAIVSAIVDHTAHHRGALTIYARLLGKVPGMPYSAS